MFKKFKKFVQSFPQRCSKCSKSGEIRNFDLYREYYEITIGTLNLRFFDNVTIYCRTCNHYSSLPEIISRKLFKKGINPQKLMDISKNFVLRSWLLSHYAMIWNMMLIVLVFFLGFIIFRFFTESVIIATPPRISVEEARSIKYSGQIVTVYGVVDYPESFAKISEQENNGVITENYEEVYLPLYKNADQSVYILVRGGPSEIANVRSREGINNSNLLLRQNFEVTGKIESIQNLGNQDIINKFTTDYANRKQIPPTNTMIDTTNNITIDKFLNRYLSYALVIFIIFLTSLSLQIYIDKKIN